MRAALHRQRCKMNVYVQTRKGQAHVMFHWDMLHAASVDLTKWYRSSTSCLISKSNDFPVVRINCQNPAAPDGDTTFDKLLSTTAKYLKSSGIPYFSKIGVIIGNHLLVFFRYRIVFE